MKTLDDYFTDWEAHTFGYGYGSGEPHTIPALRKFLSMCSTAGGSAYNSEIMELTFGPLAAWLLINILCKADVIEYGSSPRFGWLTEKGARLKDFVMSKTDDELLALTARDEDCPTCYPDACNCGPNGYEKGRVCQNPFWR